jgi:hypothetical protein
VLLLLLPLLLLPLLLLQLLLLMAIVRANAWVADQSRKDGSAASVSSSLATTSQHD